MLLKDDPYPIRRCVCHNHTLEQLKQLSQANQWTTLAQVSEHTKCGTGCGLCRPYIAAMLATGRTAFSVSEDVSTYLTNEENA